MNCRSWKFTVFGFPRIKEKSAQQWKLGEAGLAAADRLAQLTTFMHIGIKSTATSQRGVRQHCSYLINKTFSECFPPVLQYFMVHQTKSLHLTLHGHDPNLSELLKLPPKIKCNSD